MIEKIAALFILSLGAGVFAFSRSAGASFPASLSIFDQAQLSLDNLGQNEKSEFSEVDRETLAFTAVLEADSEGREGMQAVINVVMNRYKLAQSSQNYANQYGRTITEICKKPFQFSAWNPDNARLQLLGVIEQGSAYKTALELVDRAFKGDLPDITGGADHYLNIPLTMQIRGGSLPSWVDLSRTTNEIGKHTFLKLA